MSADSMVDRDPIEQLKEYVNHKPECASKSFGYRRDSILGDVINWDRQPCTCGLDALLGSARLQKERKGDETLTHVDSPTSDSVPATGGKNELASATVRCLDCGNRVPVGEPCDNCGLGE